MDPTSAARQLPRIKYVPLAHWVLAGLGGLVFIGSALYHQRNGGSLDFFAYYKAAQRFLSGQPFYVNESDYAYKYAPITIFYFLPFGLLPYTAARWAFALLQLGVVLSVPFLVKRLLGTPKAITWGTFFGFIGSLRFIDGEFRAGNCGIFLAAGLLLASLLMRSKSGRFLSLFVLGLSAVVKVHALICFAALRLFRDRTTLLSFAGVCLLILLVPSAALWPKWWIQMQETGRYAIFRHGDLNLQGFYALGFGLFEWNPLTNRSLCLAVPFALYAWLKLPRFTLGEAALNPPLFFLTLASWFLFALMCSPLPWQHTYSGLWLFIPVCWHLSTPWQKRLLAAVCVAIAITPVDIVGRPFARVFEGYQGVFACIFCLWLLFVSVADRVAKQASPTGEAPDENGKENRLPV